MRYYRWTCEATENHTGTIVLMGKDKLRRTCPTCQEQGKRSLVKKLQFYAPKYSDPGSPGSKKWKDGERARRKKVNDELSAYTEGYHREI